MLMMEIIEVFLNTFALDYSSKPETIMRQLRIARNRYMKFRTTPNKIERR